jgi:hypothetical protein
MVNQQDKLTIITCSKDDLLGLTRTLESFSGSDFQHILILTNYSQLQINSLLKKYSHLNMRVFTNQPTGIYNAMNLGMMKTNTPFFMCLNGGDEVVKIENLKYLLKQAEVFGWAYGAINIIDSVKNRKTTYRFRRYSGLKHRLSIKFIPHPSAILPTKNAVEFGLFDERFQTVADQKLMMEIAAILTPYSSPEIIANFYLGGVSSRKPRAIVQDYKEVSRKMFGLFANSSIIDNLVWMMVFNFRLARNLIKK